MIKCDKAMRRSKERCLTPFYTRWKCDGDCDSCPCALHKKGDGTWEHKKIEWAHTKKGD